jgi:SAM-dependent methyltransferase
VKAPSPCPLCGVPTTRVGDASDDDRQRLFRCPNCALIHLDPSLRISIDRERERYLLHENDAGDPGYVGFLRRLADPVTARLRPGARGLDFGCGPAPVLSGILKSAGFPCAAYDPFFAPDEALLKSRYDFVTCSEVVEHARDPAEMFATLRRLLAPGGILGVMTLLYESEAAFADWWYTRDPTHVCFYDETTMRWIGERFGWTCELAAPNVTLFTAPREMRT